MTKTHAILGWIYSLFFLRGKKRGLLWCCGSLNSNMQCMWIYLPLCHLLVCMNLIFALSVHSIFRLTRPPAMCQRQSDRTPHTICHQPSEWASGSLRWGAKHATVASRLNEHGTCNILSMAQKNEWSMKLQYGTAHSSIVMAHPTRVATLPMVPMPSAWWSFSEELMNHENSTETEWGLRST